VVVCWGVGAGGGIMFWRSQEKMVTWYHRCRMVLNFGGNFNCADRNQLNQRSVRD
jgi:hypothetical protein